MTRFEEAVCFAIKAHSNMKRKGSDAPYILHLMDVTAIVGLITIDEDLLIAAVLHDTVEDTDVTADEIREKFGNRVAELVAAETENKRPEIPAEQSWKIRKLESLEKLRATKDTSVKILWIADKLSNMRSLYKRWKMQGDAVWEMFNQKNPSEQAWYYRTALIYLSELRETEAWHELYLLTEKIFDKY